MGAATLSTFQQLIDLTERPLGDGPEVLVPNPGAFLQTWLHERSISQLELADRMSLSAKHVNMLIKGRAALTPMVALRLERVTEIPARIWCLMEADFRIATLRDEAVPA